MSHQRSVPILIIWKTTLFKSWYKEKEAIFMELAERGPEKLHHHPCLSHLWWQAELGNSFLSSDATSMSRMLRSHNYDDI